jgi:hypothetical protein
MVDAGLFLIPAVHEVAAAAEPTIAAEAAEKPDTDPLPHCPTLNAWTERIDATDDLVARDTRINNTGKDSIDGR